MVKLTRTMNKCHLNTELSSHEGTRCEFNRSKAVIKLGIDVHQEFYVVAMQEGGSNPKPAQRFSKEAFVHWAARLKKQGGEVHAVYEACGFGFGLQRKLNALGINCQVVCPQKLDEHNKRVKTDSMDAKALCLKLDRFVQGNGMRWRWCACPAKKKSNSARSIGSANSWLKRAKSWKPRDAVSWSITESSR